MEINKTMNNLRKMMVRGASIEDFRKALLKAKETEDIGAIFHYKQKGSVETTTLIKTALDLITGTIGTEDIKYGYIKEILDAGGDPNRPICSYIKDALDAAIQRQEYDIAKLLLEYGAEPNKTNYAKQTPLHHLMYYPMEAWSKACSLICDLAEAGADINAKDKDGNTPLSIYCKSLCEYDSSFFIDGKRSDHIIGVLTGFGADPNIYPKNADSPFACVVLSRPNINLNIPKEAYPKVIEELLKVTSAQAQAIETLLFAGANPKSSSPKFTSPYFPGKRLTALQFACVKGNIGVAETLLRKEAAEPQEYYEVRAKLPEIITEFMDREIENIRVTRETENTNLESYER